MQFGDGPAVYVTGQVVLDAPAFTQAMAVPGGGPVARAIVLHELAHVVGLGHVDDPAELMYPYAGRADLGAGDLTGLALLGAGACIRRDVSSAGRSRGQSVHSGPIVNERPIPGVLSDRRRHA